MKKIIYAILLLLTNPTQSQTFFEKESAFLVEKQCFATVSIKRSDKADFKLEQKVYPALGLNKKDGTHAYIVTPQGKKWVDLNCGKYWHFDFKETKPEGKFSPSLPKVDNNTKPGKIETKTATKAPFFDTIDNPVKVGNIEADMTPLPPKLNEFDQKLLKLCGEGFNADVDLVDFQQVIADNDRILKETETDLEEFRAIWFNGDGFKHIFCGEIKPQDGSLWGLHWAPRYLDLQQKGIAGRLQNNSREEVVPGHIYTIGVEATINGKNLISSIKGYPLSISAEDLLIETTRIYLKNPNPGEPQACMKVLTADDGTKLDFLFASKNDGVRTMYPDATPDKNKASCKQ